MKDYEYFVTIVAGDNPYELMKKYDNKIKVKPYIVYKYKDAVYLKAKYVEMYSALLCNKDLSKREFEEIDEILHDIQATSSDDFYFDLVADFELDEDNNALSNKNPIGKWSYFELGKIFSIPFITKDGNEVFQAQKKDIDWKLMHLNNKEIYEAAWETVIEKRNPENDIEKKIYENMKNKKNYLLKFHNKETYVLHSTAFWGYAFLDENQWIQLEDNISEFEWVKNFYSRFIEPLPDNTLLTIFETKK